MIRVLGVSKRLSEDFELKNITLTVPPGTITALIGSSGSGKSTILRLISGLILPDQGSILVDGQDIRQLEPSLYRRRIGFMVQQGGLFPHLNIADNVLLVGRYLKLDRAMLAERLGVLCELVALPVSLMQRYPHQLSGGQRQRASLMRALMLDPAILLLDEPLGALDPIVRSDLQQELKELFVRLNKTVVLVTHDLNEADRLASQLVLMDQGCIVQHGTLQDLIQRPATRYVERFVAAWRQTSVTVATQTPGDAP